MKQPCVYMLASARNGTLYVGVTSDLVKRVWEHREHPVKGFTEKYDVHLLVYYGTTNFTKRWTPPSRGKSRSRSGTGHGNSN